jgi:hypothetical protein
MKIIDIFNKIANGKVIPKRIKYNEKIWEYDDSVGDYHIENDEEYLFIDLFDTTHIQKFINRKVEVIGEDKDIEKITIRDKTLGFPSGEWTARNMDKAFAHKINMLIDEINKIKGAASNEQ